jgi:glycosyltransferase involved in cell wall biosynthesis
MSKYNRLPRILAICATRIPSAELGVIIPFTQLSEQGICIFTYRNERAISLVDIGWCDILIIIRGAGFQSVWAAKEAKRLGRVIIGYWDDNLLEIPEYSLSYPYYSSPEVKDSINTIFKLTDAFFTPSPRLAVKLSSINHTMVKVLPQTSWSADIIPNSKKTNYPSIVGFSGSKDHVDLLNSFLYHVIDSVANTGENMKVHIVGPKPNFLNKLSLETIYTPYIQNYHSYLNFAAKLGWDIGLAPQVDSEFTCYKYHTKFLEYSHIGCAGIYSNLEIYANVIQDGVTGLLVDNSIESWRNAISRLLNNPDLRDKISTNARELVRSNYSKKVVANEYANAFSLFLNYRAPKIRTTYLVLASMTSRYKQLYSDSIKYIKAHGLIRFLWVAPRYGLSMLLTRIMQHLSRKN